MALFWSEVLTAKYNDLRIFMSILKKILYTYELFNELYINIIFIILIFYFKDNLLIIFHVNYLNAPQFKSFEIL